MNDFFTGVLDFKQENVKQYTNISKAEIIKVLENLRQESQQFDSKQKREKTGGNLAICVIWVGHSLNSRV